MKVMLLIDLEGVSLLDDTRAMTPDFPELYAVAREEMTEDTNAAVRGLRKGGATEIVVVDGHGARLWPDLFNVIPEKLETGVELRRGAAALEKPSGLDAVAMVGMHCRNGTPVGFLGHTTSGFTAVKFNGEWFGEAEMLAAVAGYYGVPTILVTGDDATVREARHYMPWIEGVVVKKATGRISCDCFPGEVTRPLIQEAAERALRNLSQMKPLVVSPPVTTEVFFPSTRHADLAASIPRAIRSGETSLTYVADHFLEARRFFSTALRLASAVSTEATIKFLASDEATKARLSEYNREQRLAFWNAEPWIVVDLPPEVR
ncbi:MAG: M55 family metallopeptidase [Anaerolineae bacterium]